MNEHHAYSSFKEKILSDGSRVCGRVAFEYIAADGSLTRRVVDIVAFFSKLASHYCLGHCHLRGELRTFDSDRSCNVWDVTERRWYRDLRDWVRIASRVRHEQVDLTDSELHDLCSGRQPTSEESIAIEDCAASRDIRELAASCKAVGSWRVDLDGSTGTGKLTLKIFPLTPSNAKFQLIVSYVPKIAIQRRLESASPPQWAVEHMPWHVVPKWPQPVRGYRTFEAVITTLYKRQILD